MYFQDLFLSRLNELTSGFKSEKSALFFKGFGNLQNRAVLTDGGLCDADILFGADGALDIRAVENTKDEAAQQMLRRPFSMGIYEQLTAMLTAVPDLAERFGGTIVIVENNLFSRVFPACIPTRDAAALYAYFRQETSGIPSGLEPYLNYYCDVLSLDARHYFVSPAALPNSANLRTVPLFSGSGNAPADSLPKSETVPISGGGFLLEKAALLENVFPSPATYTADSHSNPEDYGFGAYAGILQKAGIPFGFRRQSEFNAVPDTPEDEFLPLLKKYWGDDASFRRLKFYRDPGSTNETVELTQGQIISQIVRQSEAALAGNGKYSNIFITAPTGAGKSLLFQLPAIHLAEKYGAVTIVITPLIALMKDQVTQLEEIRHVGGATFINSTLSFEEREKRIEEIRSGEKSIVYLAPELLVSTPLNSITGGRRIGLFVIDEAHIVTTWGKDFRADYWYLGDFLTRLKSDGIRFPVLCLTATAVYGGNDDAVNDIIDSLALENPIIFLGDVRRNNIRFDIRHVDPKSVKGSTEHYKIEQAAAAVTSYVDRGEKALVYCPFVTQVDDIYNSLSAEVRQKVKKYYGTLDKRTRDAAQASFQQGDCRVMICTKAFGMGVDVKDISSIYHFAPTGGLSDYVQEIGRAAREDGAQGCASADFLPSDIRYAGTLYGISEMSQCQLREMLRKIHGIHEKSGRRNLFVSSDDFSYLFNEKELENKVKNGLLLLSKDLGEKYGTPVLQVRPQTAFTKNYVNVPGSAEKEFTEKYGDYAQLLKDRTKRILPSKNKRYESDTTVFNSGRIYELDTQGIWENCFQGMSLMQFKHLFFNGELFRCSKGERLSPRLCVRAAYRLPFTETLEKFKAFVTFLSGVFRNRKNLGKVFTAQDFKSDLTEVLGDKFEFSDRILELFLADISRNISFRSSGDRLKFIAARKSPSGEFNYRFMNSGYLSMPNYLCQLAAQCVPGEDNVYQAFIPFGRNGKRPERLRLMAFLELLGLVVCRAQGGQDPDIFVRINDPAVLKFCASLPYENAVLSGIKEHHRSALNDMLDFMEQDCTNTQRWDRIENYFLGRKTV